jgi:chemotaxis protein CheD
MLHSMLPEASINPIRAEAQPAVFCDTALETFLSGLSAYGANLVRSRFWLAGGASASHFNYFDIGRRNVVMMKRLLWGKGLLLCAEDTGGELSRTFRLDLECGRATIRSAFGERELGARDGN